MSVATSEEVLSTSDPSASAAPVADGIWSRKFVELLLTQFVFGLGFSTFYLLPKFLRTELKATATEIGVVMGTALLAAVGATPFTAVWLNRGERRNPALLAIVMLFVSALAMTQVHRLGPLLLVVRVAQGVAFTLFISTMVTRGAELVTKARLSQAMGYVGLAALVTNALSPLVAEPIANRYGWTTVFLMAAGYLLLTLPLILRLGREAQPNATTFEARRSYFDSYHLRVGYATAVCGVALGVLFTFTQPLILERGGKDVGALFSGYVLGACSVRLLLPKLADRFGRARVSIIALVVYAGVIALTLRVTVHTLIFAGMGLGVTHGILYPALNAMALERATAKTRGAIATLFNGAFSLGYAISVLGFGVVADVFGFATVFIGTAMLALSGALSLLKMG